MAQQTFPQAGIISSLDTKKGLAKVFIGLLQMETDWCEIAKNLLYEEKITLEKPVLQASPPSTIDRPPGSPAISYTAVNATGGTVEKQTYNSLRVGDEVLVVFLNGDPHTPVVAARL